MPFTDDPASSSLSPFSIFTPVGGSGSSSSTSIPEVHMVDLEASRPTSLDAVIDVALRFIAALDGNNSVAEPESFRRPLTDEVEFGESVFSRSGEGDFLCSQQARKCQTAFFNVQRDGIKMIKTTATTTAAKQQEDKQQ